MAASARYPAAIRSSETILERFRPARVGDPEADDRERRLVVVLLEEHPLQDLRALVPVRGTKSVPLAEVPENRAGLRERPAVVEHERRDAERRIEAAEQVGVERSTTSTVRRSYGNPEVRQQEPHLVAVAETGLS